MYGFDQNGLLYGVELASGKRLWQSGEPLKSKRPLDSGTAFIIKNGARFWMFNERGELLITKLSPQGYEEIDRAKVIEPTNVAFGRDVGLVPARLGQPPGSHPQRQRMPLHRSGRQQREIRVTLLTPASGVRYKPITRTSSNMAPVWFYA